MQNCKIGLKNQEFKRVEISTSHIWFTIIVFLIRTKKANVQFLSESKGATFSLKNREFPKIRHSKTQHSTVWYIFFWLFRSSASEINRYSANPDVAGESELGARSVSPTSGYTRPGKRRRRSDKDNIPPGVRKLPSPPTTLEQAQMEWDLVETVQPGTKCRPFTNSFHCKVKVMDAMI